MAIPKKFAADGKKVEVKAHIKSGPLAGKKVAVLLDADDLVKEQVGGFVNFLREHAIVGLAVGFVAGAQAQAVVKQLIESFISPSLALLLGGVALEDRKFHLTFWGNGEDFSWGKMVAVLINLIFVLATIYILIKVLNLDKLDKPKDKAADTDKTKPKKSGKAAVKKKS